MSLRVAINGFGRIGRLVYRAILESKVEELEVVCINDLGPTKSNAHLLKYDSTHGILPQEIIVGKNTIDVGQGPVKITSERDPTKLPWKELNIDIAFECTGFFASKEKASSHIRAGAKRVIVSAPASGADITVVYGVNDHLITDQHIVISNASCTTNCLAPIAHILNEKIGIERGFMTTIHSFTGDQRTLDTLHDDLHRSRTASASMIPTSTGAARAVGLVLPELNGKLDGTSIRVPTPNVSLIDFTFNSQRDTSVEEINNIIKSSSENGRLLGVLGYNELPLVSIDFNHNPLSSIFDASETQVIGNNLVRVLSWYDNEWGFSNRMIDTALTIGKTI